MKNVIKGISLMLILLCYCQLSTAQEDLLREKLNVQGNVIIGGDPAANPELNGNANGIVRLGWPGFPGCMGHFGRFCRLTNGIPDGRYDLIKYLNAKFDGQQFAQIDPNYDVWISGLCIAPNPEQSGYEISYAPAGNEGDIEPTSRFKIDHRGWVGICSNIPEATLDIQNEDPQTASIRLGLTPNGVSSCRRVWCPGGRDYIWDYANATFDGGRWFPQNPEFGSFRRQVCTGPEGATLNMGPAAVNGGGLQWIPSLSIIETGTVGINTDKPNPEVQLDVNGIFEALDFVQRSDERYKKNIAPLKNSLSKVSQLKAVEYQFKTEEFKEKAFDEGTQMGFIAQEIKNVYPEIVTEDKEGYLSISYISLIPVLADAIKDLKAKNEALVEELAEIKDTVGKLNSKNDFSEAKGNEQ